MADDKRYELTLRAAVIDSLLNFLNTNKNLIAMKSEIPVNVSDLLNDENFIDNTVDNLVNYYTKNNTYSKTEVNNLITAASFGGFITVQELPTEDINVKAIYLVPSTTSRAKNVYDEYIYSTEEDDWELIGNTKIDLSNYYTKSEVYNKTEAYNKTEVYNKTEAYSKTEVDTLLSQQHSGHKVSDEGTLLTDRDTLNFTDFDISDDSTNEETDIKAHKLTAAEMAEIMAIPPGSNVNDSNPVGTIISFMGTNAPNGYLACDGSVVNISEYTRLANHITTQFGSVNFFGGDGTTTFAVPDLRGEFLRGTGANSHTDQGAGANVGVHQDGTDIPVYYTGLSASSTVFFGWRYPNNAATGSYQNVHNADFAIAGEGYAKYGTIAADQSSQSAQQTSHAYTLRPTNTSVLYCIKY